MILPYMKLHMYLWNYVYQGTHILCHDAYLFMNEGTKNRKKNACNACSELSCKTKEIIINEILEK